jgi:TonB-dependent receptor
MRAPSITLRYGCLCAGLAALIGAPRAQPATGNGPAPDPSSTVVVTGKRASLASAQADKRERLEIVDSVVADDIQKLPDLSVSDALQRVTGVQIARDRGDGTGITIRGLTQMETTLNGREVFTAGTGRTLDFADIPAEMVSAIRVYKTSSAAHIEGGVGGSIDLRTRQPFDFAGREIVVSTRVIHGDLARRSEPQLSALLSQRWQTRTAGEWGVLLNLSHQRRAWREDQKSAGNPLSRDDLVPGQSVTAPNGTSETTSVGLRQRSASTLIVQWRPSSELELTAEAHYARFHTRQDSQQINVSASPTFLPGSVALFPGTNDVQRITWTNAPVSVLSFARDTVDRTRQAALGARFTRDALTLRADASITRSFNNLFFSGPFMAGTAAQFTQDLAPKLPATSVSGTNLLDPSTFHYTGVAYRTRPFDGELKALQLDAEYRPSGGFFSALSAGLRVAHRSAGNAPGLIQADAPVSGLTPADMPGFTLPNPYNDFFPGESGSLRNFLVGNLDLARDATALRNAFGITAPIPSSASPLTLWSIRERTQAAYLMARFEAFDERLGGNAGLRLVSTRESVSGAQSVPATGTTAPVQLDTSSVDALPSMNLRYRLSEGTQLRAALSRTLTRPAFDQLSPSLTLIRNPINPGLNQGGAGNPALRPVRSTNLDFALERYFDRNSSAYATAFVKKVDGFVATLSRPETYDGVTYQVSRPQNTDKATVKGLEVGYQQFFDRLPAPWRGLGAQLNYTYVDSSASNSVIGQTTPLQGLSRHSANLVALYERGPVSARIAYNWRSRFVNGFVSVVGVGIQPAYTRGYGWLDASMSYRFSDRVTLAIEGTNLLRTMRRSYYGVETRPQSHWVNDMQLGAALTLRF